LNRPLGIVFEEVGQAKWLSFSNPALRPFYFVEASIYNFFFAMAISCAAQKDTFCALRRAPRVAMCANVYMLGGDYVC
jgi:hypothetical protein